MSKLLIILLVICVVTVSVNILQFKAYMKLKKKYLLSKKENESYRNIQAQIEKNISETNEKKKKIHTGNPDTNIDNATAIMSDVSKKIRNRVSNSARS